MGRGDRERASTADSFNQSPSPGGLTTPRASARPSALATFSSATPRSSARPSALTNFIPGTPLSTSNQLHIPPALVTPGSSTRSSRHGSFAGFASSSPRSSALATSPRASAFANSSPRAASPSPAGRAASPSPASKALRPSLVTQAEKAKTKSHAEESREKESQRSPKKKSKNRRKSVRDDEDNDAQGRKGSKKKLHDCFDAIYFELMLRDCTLFRGCAPCALIEFAQRIHCDAYEGGQEIMRKGRSTPNLLFVLSGSIDIVIDEVKVDSMSIDGAYIGEALWFGLENVWTVSVIAATPCSIGCITRQQLLQVVAKFPEVVPWLREIENLAVGHCTHASVETSCGVFEGMTEETINGLSRLPITRLYFAGQNLIEEKEEGDELYILARGHVSVIIADRVVNSVFVDAGHKPACFGEIGLLGLQTTRSATVRAQSVCMVRILYRSVFLQEMRFQKESLRLQQVTGALQHRFAHLANLAERANRLTEIAMFKNAGCSSEFLDFLSRHLEGLIFLKDQLVVEENTDDKSMYFLTHGVVKVLKRGVEVARLKPGHIFGEMVMLGLVEKRTGTVVAIDTCYAERLHQSTIIRGLELFPDDRSRVFAAARITVESAGLTAMSKDTFVNMFKHHSATWQSLDDTFLETLSLQSVDRIFLPGESITEEGTVGHSMFLLVTGTAGVYSQGEQWSGNTSGAPIYKKATLNAGSAFGELAMLGVITTRSATIKAETFCLLWELEQSKVQEVLAKFPGARRVFVPLILKSLEPSTAQRFLGLPLFKNFGKQFKLLLALECERRVYFPQELIARGGVVGAGMYILNVGEAVIKTSNIVVMSLTAGNHFASNIMLGSVKRCLCNLQAVTVCHVLIVTPESYHSALLQYPTPSLAIQLAQAEAAAYQELKEAAEVMQARANVFSHTLTHMGHDADMIVTELLAAAFFFWLHYTKEMLEKRAETMRRSKRRWDEQSWALKLQAHHHARIEQERNVVQHLWLRGKPPEAANQIEWTLPTVASSVKAPAGSDHKMRQQARDPNVCTSRHGRRHVWKGLYVPIAPSTSRADRPMSKLEERSIIRNLMYEQDLFKMLENQALSARA